MIIVLIYVFITLYHYLILFRPQRRQTWRWPNIDLWRSHSKLRRSDSDVRLSHAHVRLTDTNVWLTDASPRRLSDSSLWGHDPVARWQPHPQTRWWIQRLGPLPRQHSEVSLTLIKVTFNLNLIENNQVIKSRVHIFSLLIGKLSQAPSFIFIFHIT